MRMRFAAIAVLLLCAMAMPAHAAIITVTNLNDSGPGSLRQALAEANDGDTITFAVTGTITLTSGELVIDKGITISGPGPNLLAVSISTPIGCGLFEYFDNVTPPVLPPGWTAVNAIDPDGILWQTSNSGNPTPPADSPPNAAWVNDPAAISDKYLHSPPITIDSLESAALTFHNNYALENTFDGGVLEVSIDSGPFQDILAAGGFFGQGGYNGTISACCGNPLAGRNAWTGSSGGFIETDVDLTGFGGHTIVLRWRMGSDSSGSGDGWRVDNVQIICERPTPTPTATVPPSPTPTATPTPTPTPSATPTATPTSTPRPTPTPRPNVTPRPHPTPPPRPTP